MALAAGFNAKSARAIADANQGIDDHPETSPMGALPFLKHVKIRKLYHFTTQARRDDMWSKFEVFMTLQDLGAFFHAQQDSFSHEGYGPIFGHLKDGHGPNKTFNRPSRADMMALDTFNKLKTALSRLVIYGKETIHYDAVEWKTVMPMVEAFNRATTRKEKQKIINQIEQEVQYRHYIQDQVREVERSDLVLLVRQ